MRLIFKTDDFKEIKRIMDYLQGSPFMRISFDGSYYRLRAKVYKLDSLKECPFLLRIEFKPDMFTHTNKILIRKEV